MPNAQDSLAGMEPVSPMQRRTQLRSAALLMSSGAGLLGAQYVASRELGSTFFVTELSVGAAVLVTLIGPSIGYALGERLRRTDRLLDIWAAAALLLHLSLPFCVRGLVGCLGGSAVGTAAAALLSAAIVAILCGYYAVLLPLRAAVAPLPVLYAAELAGALLMLLFCAAAPSWRVFLTGYAALPVVIMLLGHRRALAALCVGLCAAAALLQPRLDRLAAQAYFRGYHGHAAPRIVETTYSPYQRIDVVEDRGALSLYLDGVPFYRSGDLSAFNQFLAEVPGSLLAHSPAAPALVIGSGSFSSAAKLRKLGYAVTVVELDAAVADAGLRRFQPLHGLLPGDLVLRIDDGRRALARSNERYRMIALDVPAPYRVQTALLHTPKFYKQVAAHLAPDGVASLSLCDGVDGPLGRRIAAAAAQAFGEVMVVESQSVGIAILYGAARLPFSVAEVADALRARDPAGGRVLADQTVRQEALGASPITEKDLLGVLLLSRHAHGGD